MATKWGFMDFCKILSIVFPGNNLKGKLIFLLIFHHRSSIWQHHSGSQAMGQNSDGQSNGMIL